MFLGSQTERVAPAKDVVQYLGDTHGSWQQAANWNRTQEKIRLISWGSMSLVSDIKLIRTDTTLDLSQKAEKGISHVPTTSLYIPSPRKLRNIQYVWGNEFFSNLNFLVNMVWPHWYLFYLSALPEDKIGHNCFCLLTSYTKCTVISLPKSVLSVISLPL
jgi:hypothetical protein